MRRGFIERGGWWVLGQSALMMVVLVSGPLTAGGWGRGGVRWAAWAFLALGAGLGIAGARVLGQNRTIFPRPQETSTLVIRGIYRWVRHPLYASLMSLSLGWGLLWGSSATLLEGLVMAVFLRLKAAREELWLEERFPEYTRYATRVRRFVPGLW